jgi:cell wall-associated NlpC family hydrolase
LILVFNAQAAPDDDAMLQWLYDKGLLQPAAQAPSPQPMADGAAQLVLSALNFLDVPYRYGGLSPVQGFDCSGFTRHIFAQTLGLVLPHRADQQAQNAALAPVGKAELRPGDLVFFNTLKRAFSHVGIYIGDGKFVHAPRRGGRVRVENMGSAYWVKRFDGARRAAEAAGPAAPGSEPSER